MPFEGSERLPQTSNIVFMFSGQGSQYFQMGRELYQNNSVFRFWMNHCDSIGQPLLGQSLSSAIYGEEDKSKPFDNIHFSNPCLLAIEYCVAMMLIELGVKPNYLLGYSLGEIAAATVAEVISLEDGLRLAIGIADLAQENTPQAKMLAILDPGGNPEQHICLPPKCWITARNFQGNIVVSGTLEGIEQIQRQIRIEGKIAQELPVKLGFHTELIDPIESMVKNLARSIPKQTPRFPLLSSLKKGIIESLNEQYVWDILRWEILFPETVEWLVSQGEFHFIDVGPSGSLANFVKYILPLNSRSSTWQAMNQFGRDTSSIEKLRARFAAHQVGRSKGNIC